MSLHTNRIEGKWAIITGATAGIGKATAEIFAEAGVKLILTGRRKERLEKLSQKLIQEYHTEIEIAAFDVSNLNSCKTFYKSVNNNIDILINNAGLAAGADPIDQADIDDWERMIDTNIKGLLYMSRLFIPDMKKRNQGHVINIGSIAGHETYPGGSVYCGTKHAVKAITQATKKDVHGTKVRVSAVSPGLVDTEFSEVRFKGDTEKADKVYSGMKPLIARDIAEIIYFMANRPDHVNIMDTIVLPVHQSSSIMVHRDE